MATSRGVVVFNPNAKINQSSAQHPVDRSLLSGIAITLLSTLGQPELEKLLNGVVTKVGKSNAGPVLLGIKGAVDNVIKKNKIKPAL